MSTEKPIEMIRAAMTIGSKSVPVRDRRPRIPVITEAMTIVTEITEKQSHMKTRQIRDMQQRVATAA